MLAGLEQCLGSRLSIALLNEAITDLLDNCRGRQIAHALFATIGPNFYDHHKS